ncbi:xanthine dehydrogenase family protein molybdopterin-binding subunit [Lentzea sp. NPDC058450]|uniref:xanthine dehydrogenase family protein molybdopterin-binding subunit n=1 Tax=Lentzea sp. NPDC058450 TaxID=3346505 RepID=UPI00366847BD
MTLQPQRAVGTPQSRVDGPLKVTGRAKFAADHGPGDGLTGVVHAVLVEGAVGRGRITSIETRAAAATKGVLAVIDHRTAPRLPYRDNPFPGSINPEGERLRALQDDQVRFFGQPVAVVVATTLEAARHAARLVEVRYATEQPVLELGPAPGREPEAYSRGDADAAWQSADVKLDLTYRLSRNHHNAMEPHAIIARWDGDRLTVWDKTQWVADSRNELAAVFGIPEESVRCISPFVGGAFGNGGRTWVHSVVAALAARQVGRPVKLVLTRRQQYFGTGFRPAYEFRARVGSDRTGRVSAMIHEARGESSRYEFHNEDVVTPARVMYATPHVRTSYQLVPLDISTPTWMRGPGWGTGAHVVETAMDELAHELRLDPIELRLRNDPRSDPETGKPYSTRRLRECCTTGAREFGWNRRKAAPRSTRDGDWLVGMGMAAGVYPTESVFASAHARLDADGTVVVQSATSEIGPGTYTSMSQVAADALGVDVASVRFLLGDTTMPTAPIQAVSWTMASVGSAVQTAGDRLRRQAITLAVHDPRSPLHGRDPGDILVRSGRMQVRNDPTRAETYQQLLRRNSRTHLEVIGTYEPPEESAFSTYAYAAIFAEVGVDVRLGTVRVRRMLGVFDAGRIVNPKLADSQALGGMIGGIGQALLEHTDTDPRDGRIVNANFADYLVPTNADIPEIRAIYVDGVDTEADPLGVKGLGEVVICGVAPAVANAVFNATGTRVRELPITRESLLG